uniref:NADH-ubiquinone oxidoreductase chain 4 n=1 Tax=Antrokoreana gracilipes TaxID=364406 RepID=A9X4I8_ANTGC|nr:NADH dehydrogenase subunit 4 [Antrokoreana gracilipes]ABC55888.1 NADH dehydrogenase subunit 4 [Antrokoreana gracilipes]
MLKVVGLLLVMFIMPLFGRPWKNLYLGLVLASLMFLPNMNMELGHKLIMGLDFGGDMMSLGLTLLSFWIVMLMVVASTSTIESSGGSYFSFLMVVLILLLMGVFLSVDLFSFYLSFESVLIPTYILIVGWGYQPERLQAGIYLMFYTLLASLPLLIVILFFDSLSGAALATSLVTVTWTNHWLSVMLYVAGVLAFLIKVPLFLFHLWLPKAHVEAPIAGSMLLAGVLLKMGGYGLFRFSAYFMGNLSVVGCLWTVVGLTGGVFLSLVCLRQSDVKSLIAYSSVVHMGLVVGGLVTMSWLGVVGSYVLMFSHGLCSSGLFCLANMNYMQIHSRSLILNSGLINLIPSGALIWFLLASSNMAAPPSLNLLGEITLIGSLLGWNFNVVYGLGLMSFFSASYCLYLYSFTQHGEPGKMNFNYPSIEMKNFLLIFLHWSPLNLLFLKPDLFYI